MEYSVGDKIIFNKDYIKKFNCYTTKENKGWIEPWLIGRTATITRISEEVWYYIDIPNIPNTRWYYIDIPDTHGYDEHLFSKLEVFVEL